MQASGLVSKKLLLWLSCWCFGVGAALTACGGKSGEDDSGGSAGNPTDTGGGAISGSGSGGTGTSGSSNAGTGGLPLFDAGLDGAAQVCLDCVTATCPEALACVTDPACVEGAICGVTSCADQDGSSAISCFLDCFEDPEMALGALQAATCVASSCGTDCMDLVGQFGQ